jgi:hypothetical protein
MHFHHSDVGLSRKLIIVTAFTGELKKNIIISFVKKKDQKKSFYAT